MLARAFFAPKMLELVTKIQLLEGALKTIIVVFHFHGRGKKKRSITIYNLWNRVKTFNQLPTDYRD
jgi:hypothetical protein